jgi:hypothetical protein
MSNGQSKSSAQIPVPQRDNVTKSQVDTLLQIASLMANVLVNPQRDFEGTGTSLDGGAHTAAVNTFVNVCSKLDEIVSCKDRFGFDYQTLLERQMFEHFKQNTLFVREQTEAVRELNTPHSRYRPNIIKMLDGNWAVILGNVADLDNAIVGIGITPQQAIESFDGMFTGNLPQHLIDYLKTREDAINKEIPSPPYPTAESPKPRKNKKS